MVRIGGSYSPQPAVNKPSLPPRPPTEYPTWMHSATAATSPTTIMYSRIMKNEYCMKGERSEQPGLKRQGHQLLGSSLTPLAATSCLMETTLIICHALRAEEGRQVRPGND